MRVILGTHALVWWLAGDDHLSLTARSAISDERNDIFVSAASAWVVSTKHRIGRRRRWRGCQTKRRLMRCRLRGGGEELHGVCATAPPPTQPPTRHPALRQTPEDIDAAICQLVSSAIATNAQAIDVFTAAGW